MKDIGRMCGNEHGTAGTTGSTLHRLSRAHIQEEQHTEMVPDRGAVRDPVRRVYYAGSGGRIAGNVPASAGEYNGGQVPDQQTVQRETRHSKIHYY